MNNEENTHFSLINKNNIYCEMQHLNKKSLIINNSDRQMRLFFFPCASARWHCSNVKGEI